MFSGPASTDSRSTFFHHSQLAREVVPSPGFFTTGVTAAVHLSIEQQE